MKYVIASLLLTLGTGPELARAASPPPSSWTARVVDSDALLRSYGFPSKIIEVTFPKSFPTNVVKSVRNYQLSKSDDPGANFEIQGVRLGPNLHGDEEEGAESPSKVSRAYLLPRLQLEPPGQNQAYILKVVFGDESSGDIPVSWPAGPPPKPPPSDNELLNIISVTSNLFFGPFNFSVDARSPLGGSHIPAFDVQLAYHLPRRPFLDSTGTNFDRMWILSADVAAEGTFKLDDSDRDIADHVFASANVELLRLFRLGDPLTAVDPITHKRQGKLAYYWGLRLKALELEADQNFDLLNLAVEPQFAAWVPFSNIPALWWIRNVGIHENAATPLFVYAGYSFVNSLREDPARVSSDIQKDDRLELELAYAFPLTSRLRAGLRSRFFWLLDESIQRNYQEIYLRYYLDKNKNTALLLKYTRGALPPKFERGEATSAGFSLDF